MNERVREGAEDGSVALGQQPSGCSKAVFCFNYCLRKEVRDPVSAGFGHGIFNLL